MITRFVIAALVFATFGALGFATTIQFSKELEQQANRSAAAWRVKHRIITSIDQIKD